MSPRGRPRRADVYARFEAAATDLTRLGWSTVPDGSSRNLGRHLAPRGPQFHRHRGQHPYPAGSRSPPRHRPRRRRQGTPRLPRSRRLRTGREMGVHPGPDDRRLAQRRPDHRHRDPAHPHRRHGTSLGSLPPPRRRPIRNTRQLPPARHPPLRWRHDTTNLDRRTQPPRNLGTGREPTHLFRTTRVRPRPRAAAHPGPVALPIRTNPPLHRRQRPGRTAHVEPHPGPHGMAAGHHLQTGQKPVPHRS